MQKRFNLGSAKINRRNKTKLAFDLLETEMKLLPTHELKAINGEGDDVLRINGGTLYADNGGTTCVGDNGSVVFFQGVYVSTSAVASDTAYQWYGTIHIDEGWASNSFNVSDFAHEYGHYIQQQVYGNTQYTAYAAGSMYSVYTDPENHNDHWFEQEATNWGTDYMYNHMTSYN